MTQLLMAELISTELIDVTKVRSRQYGGVVRALDLYSGGPRFKPSKLLLWIYSWFPQVQLLGCALYTANWFACGL